MLNLDRLAIYGISGLVLIILSIFFYYSWKTAVSQAANAEWNKKQLETIIREQAIFMGKLQETNQLQKLVVQELLKKNKDMELSLESLEKELDSEDTKKQYQGTQSSKVLKDTIKRLEEMRKANEE